MGILSSFFSKFYVLGGMSSFGEIRGVGLSVIRRVFSLRLVREVGKYFECRSGFRCL